MPLLNDREPAMQIEGEPCLILAHYGQEKRLNVRTSKLISTWIHAWEYKDSLKDFAEYVLWPSLF